MRKIPTKTFTNSSKAKKVLRSARYPKRRTRSDINPPGNLWYTLTRAIYLRCDMPCGAWGDLYHIAPSLRGISQPSETRLYRIRAANISPYRKREDISAINRFILSFIFLLWIIDIYACAVWQKICTHYKFFTLPLNDVEIYVKI